MQGGKNDSLLHWLQIYIVCMQIQLYMYGSSIHTHHGYISQWTYVHYCSDLKIYGANPDSTSFLVGSLCDSPGGCAINRQNHADTALPIDRQFKISFSLRTFLLSSVDLCLSNVRTLSRALSPNSYQLSLAITKTRCMSIPNSGLRQHSKSRYSTIVALLVKWNFYWAHKISALFVRARC